MKNLTRRMGYMSTVFGLLFVVVGSVATVAGRDTAYSVKNRRVKIWVKSFIPFPRVDMTRFGPCFSGDNRSFSESPEASCRTHQEIELEVTPYKLINQTSFTGKTHKVDCSTSKPIISAQAKSNRLRNGPISANGHTVNVRMAMAANNPLVFGAPDLDLELSLDFDWPGSAVTLTVRHDGFPAYEIYMSVDGRSAIKLYQFSPRGNTFQDHLRLFHPMDERFGPVTRYF